VQAYKSAVTRRARRTGHWDRTPLWQRNYFEHVIRDDGALARIREYIACNPLSWELDREDPHGTGSDAFHEWLDEYSRRTGAPGCPM